MIHRRRKGKHRFRDQLSTPEHRLAFARRFGGVDLERPFAAVPGYLRISRSAARLSRRRWTLISAGKRWRRPRDD